MRWPGLIGGRLGVAILRRYWPQPPERMDGSTYAGRSKVRTLLGDAIVERCRGRQVVDFGCGDGADAVELAREGARAVIGVDIQPHLLDVARARADAAGVSDRTAFVAQLDAPADVIVSLDSFEHFDDPAAILHAMAAALAPDGDVFVSFGPTWYHPLGGHLFSVFPWAHLVFTERALCTWRRDFKADGATRFREVAGGLNQMTIRRFERLVAASPLAIVSLECVPIRAMRRVHSRLTREWTTAIVRAHLRHRHPGSRPASAPPHALTRRSGPTSSATEYASAS